MKFVSNQDTHPHIAFAYVGIAVPDELSVHNPAFNRAGNMWQTNLLSALRKAGVPPSLILSQRPMRAFPNSRTIVAVSGRGILPGGLSIRLIPFLNFPILRPLTVGMFVLARLIRWGWANRAVRDKVVYTFNLTEPPAWFTLMAARLIGAKAIASVNDINVPGETVPLKSSYRLNFWLHKKLIPRFDGLVIVNNRIVEDFAPQVPFLRMEGGISDEVLQRSIVRKRKSDAPFTIVSTGSLNEINGFPELLEAFSLLKGENYRLRIAGVGPLEARIRKAAETDGRIEYCGYLSFDQVLALYDDADVLVNMRLTQKVKTDYFFPSKIFEYLASGVPVISTCPGRVEEEFGEFLHLLKEETPLKLAELIGSIESVPPKTRAENGDKVREYMAQNKTWDAQGRLLVEFMDGLFAAD